MTGLQVVSLFSGIEGLGAGCEQAGMTVVVCVEIDPVCQSVIRRHFPKAIILSDIREVTGDLLRSLGVDPVRCVLVFGWPCQDLSVAGRRAGLAGTRSGLFWEAMRLARELSPRWFVAENVPGLLSAVCTCPGDQTCLRAGRARACGRWDTKRIGGRKRRVFTPHVLHSVSGGACPGGCMARHGGAMGTVVGAMGELGYGVAYRVLDAQHFGVPQRRRRVFFVGCLGDWAAPSQVLFDAESRAGGAAAGGAAGEAVAGTLGGRVGGSRSTDLDGHGAYVAHTTGAGWWNEGTGTLRADGGGGDARGDHLVVETVGTLTANHGEHGHKGMALQDVLAGHVVVEPSVVSTVQGGGRRGHRVDVEGAAGGHLVSFDLAQITSDVNRVNPQPGDPAPPLNQSGQVHVAGTLRSHPRPGSNSDGAMVVQPVALRGRDGSQMEVGEPGEPALALRTGGGGSSYPMVAHALTSEGADASEDGTGRGTPLVVVAAPLARGSAASDGVNDPGRRMEDDVNLVAFASQHRAVANGNGIAEPVTGSTGQPGNIATGTAIRRLTPLECERLQGFPDGWTQFDDQGKPISDAARYRMIGNAVAVTCSAWIARRLVAVDLAELEPR